MTTRMSKNLAVGIIGFGGRGRKHAKAVFEHADYEVGFVHDPQLRSSDRSALEAQGVPIHEAISAKALSSVEAVIVAVPHNEYKKVLAACRDAGVAVLMEKPFGRNLEEAEELAVLSDASTHCFVVGAQRRYSRAYSRLQHIVRSEDSPRSFSYTYALGLSGIEEGWRADKALAGGGALIDMGYHPIDLVAGLFDEPQAVRCQIELPRYGNGAMAVEPGADILFTFSSGFAGTVSMGRYRVPEEELFTIWYDDFSLRLQDEGLFKIYAGGKRELLAPPESTGKLLHEQLTEFYMFVRGMPSSVYTVAEAMRTMRLIDRCYRSAEESDAPEDRLAAV